MQEIDDRTKMSEVTVGDVTRIARGEHPATGAQLVPDKVRSNDTFTAGQEEAAAAVFAFASRWDARLRKEASRIPCNCQPTRDADASEFDHDPHCPVARVLQFARLMGEEGETIRAQVFGNNRLAVGGTEKE